MTTTTMVGMMTMITMMSSSAKGSQVDNDNDNNIINAATGPGSAIAAWWCLVEWDEPRIVTMSTEIFGPRIHSTGFRSRVSSPHQAQRDKSSFLVKPRAFRVVRDHR